MQRHNKLTRVHQYGVRLAAKGPIRRLPLDDRSTRRSRLSGEEQTDDGDEACELSHYGIRSTSCTWRSRSFRPISVDTSEEVTQQTPAHRLLDTASPHVSSVWVDLRIVTGGGAKRL